MFSFDDMCCPFVAEKKLENIPPELTDTLDFDYIDRDDRIERTCLGSILLLENCRCFVY